MKIKHDREREKRCGVPEVVFGEGKSAEDLVLVVREFLDSCGRAIITRIDEKKASAVKDSVRGSGVVVSHNREGRVLVVKKKGVRERSVGRIAVFSAGTSDIPVAEEACAVAEELGCEVVREYDVGVAGIHRVFSALERVRAADVFIVVAGMEGALPSVVSGLVKQPVIAVPTSIGYGVGAGGTAALNTMLTSCTPLAVVNIDNGFGAAVLAFKILAVEK